MIMVGQEARLHQPLDPRHKRLMLTTVLCLLIAVAAVVVYGTRQTNSYGPSANGCVTVTFASELGSAALHKCGVAAREWCSFEDARNTVESRLVTPQCRLAGFPRVAPAASGAATPSQS
jgi:hypothetical protein